MFPCTVYAVIVQKVGYKYPEKERKKIKKEQQHGILGNDNLSSVCRLSVAYPDLFGMKAFKQEIQMGQIVSYNGGGSGLST